MVFYRRANYGYILLMIYEIKASRTYPDGKTSMNLLTTGSTVFLSICELGFDFECFQALLNTPVLCFRNSKLFI